MTINRSMVKVMEEPLSPLFFNTFDFRAISTLILNVNVSFIFTSKFLYRVALIDKLTQSPRQIILFEYASYVVQLSMRQ